MSTIIIRQWLTYALYAVIIKLEFILSILCDGQIGRGGKRKGMERWTNEDGVQRLFEIFTASQRLVLKSLDYQGAHLTKYQLYLLIILAKKERLTMGQAASRLGCSKEQATRLVSALVEDGYIERLHSKENRKLVMIRLTKKGSEIICKEKEAAKERLREGLESLSEEERDIFFQSIVRLAPVLQKLENKEKD